MSQVHPRAQTLVIGIGNDLRGDDAAGLLAVRALRSRLESTPVSAPAPRIELLESDGEMTSLIEAWADVDEVILVDCSVSAAKGAGKDSDRVDGNTVQGTGYRVQGEQHRGVGSGSSGDGAATIRTFDLLDERVLEIFDAGSLRLSSHSLDLPKALGLAKLLNRLPARLTLHTIEGGAGNGSFDVGAQASNEVIQAAEKLAGLIIRDVTPSGL